MAHRLNTNKQFMVGNGILAFGVIFVVVIFIYISLKAQRDKSDERVFLETYTISLASGFAGDSVSIYLNDSLLINQTIRQEPYTLEVRRFDKDNALMVVDNLTDKISLFSLSEEGGKIVLIKDAGEIKQY